MVQPMLWPESLFLHYMSSYGVAGFGEVRTHACCSSRSAKSIRRNLGGAKSTVTARARRHLNGIMPTEMGHLPPIG
eukprot:5505928-Amphidinium_carterae.1